MAELKIKKRVRSMQVLKCQNSKCGAPARSLRLLEENQHYRAWQCQDCGHYITEGNGELFVDRFNKRRAAQMTKEEFDRAMENMKTGEMAPEAMMQLLEESRRG